MPFIKRSVEPRFLSRKPLDNSVKNDELEVVTNTTLVEALKQLACLVLFADEIFQDLTCQVKIIQSRTEILKTKLAKVDDVVSKLNAKEVTIPVATLADLGKFRPNYVSSQPIDKGFFTPSTRPAFVGRLYDSAVVSPVCVMRQIDRYRQDGRRSSKCFVCLPFFKDLKVNFDVEIELRRPASLSVAPRDWLSDDDTLDSIVIGTQSSDREGSSEGDSCSSPTPDNDDFLRQLPTPEEKMFVMSLKYPYSDVPIDVTGIGFRRMTSLRRSFIQQMENMKKKGKKRGKRRNTVSCDVDNKDVEAAIRRANKNVQLSTSGTQTGEFGGPGTSRQEHVYFDDVVTMLHEGKTNSKNKLNSLNRNKKGLLKKSEKKDCSLQTVFQDVGRQDEEKEGTSGGLRWFQRKSRNRNSIIGGIGIYEELDRVKKSRRSLLASLLPAAILEDKSAGSSPSKSSTDSAVATGSTASTSSAGGGRKANVKNRSNLPISTLSQAMSTAVKLRENSARGSSREDGGQSSSGNWSASSSTRTSMESEEPVRSAASPDLLNRTGSQTSLSKDSALSDRMTPNEERWHDSVNGYQSDSTYSSSRKPTLKFTKRTVNTARWLRSLEEEEGALGRSAGETTDAASSTGTITPRIHRRALSPSDVPLTFIDDGESSEFSVDNDGYYTSMHTDSGLRAIPASKFNAASSFGKISRLSDLHEQDQGSQSSVCSLTSSKTSSKKATSSEDTSNKDSTDVPDAPDKTDKKKIPPPPPPRTSTLSKRPTPEPQRGGSPTDSSSEREADVSTSESATSSVFKSEGAASAAPSDSEAETGSGEKFKLKTTITPGRIPSLCVVTPNPSDDEDEKGAEIRETSPTTPGYSTGAWNPSAYRTLPKSFGRSAPISGEAATNTWPRRPNRLVYRPELVAVTEQCKAESLPGDKSALPKMMSFQRPWNEVNANKRPNSIACTPNSSRPYPEWNSPTSPTSPSQVISGQSGSGARQGARVTLDSAGRVIHSTGSLPRRSAGAGPSPVPDIQQSPHIVSAAIGAKCGTPQTLPGAYVRTDAQTQNPKHDAAGNGREQWQYSQKQSPIQTAPDRQQGVNVGSAPIGTKCTPPQTRPGAYVRLETQTDGQRTDIQTRNPKFQAISYGREQCQYSQNQSSIPVANRDRPGQPQFCNDQVPEKQYQKYDNNTLPRWKPNQHDRPVPIFPNSAGVPPANYPSGSLPRRWNNLNFLRREQPHPQPLTPVAPAPSEPPSTAKNGAYVRLDGHPTHLEPGNLTKTDGTAMPNLKAPSPTAQGPPENFGRIVRPYGVNGTGGAANANSAPAVPSNKINTATARLSPTGDFAHDPRRGSVSGGAPGANYGITAPPAAMPLMRQLSYRPSRIPLAAAAAPQSQESVQQFGRVGNALPPYYKPFLAGGPGSEGTGYGRSPPVQRGGGMPAAPSAVYNTRFQNDGGRIPTLAQPPPYNYNGPNRYQMPPVQLFTRSMSTPPGDPRRHGWNGLTHLSPRTPMPPPYGYNLSGPPSPSELSKMNNVGLPSGNCNGGSYSGGLPSSPSNGGRPIGGPLVYGGMQNPVGERRTSQHMPIPACNGMQRAQTPAGDLNTYVQIANKNALPQSTSPRMPSRAPPTPNATLSTPPAIDSRASALLPRASKATMSTDDLFAAIHHSKKKMNVKTDLDRSLSPTSSRSSSPACSVSSLKCRKPETGLLSPRSRSPLCMPGDRRSWSGDRALASSSPVPSAPGDRRSWASDRLGPTRPTSMRDFKLLLLQAGRGSPKEAPVKRPSASEILKSASPLPSKMAPGSVSEDSPTSPPNDRSGTPASPRGPVATSSPIRPYGPIRNRLQNKQSRCWANGSVLHNRTDVLSTPIMEDDCSEEDSESDGNRSVSC